ncbi:regulatory protein RecX [Chloroflexota bacterium]
MTGEQVNQDCLNAALRYLSYRPRSEKEIKLCLNKRGFDDSSIESVLQSLREQLIVDDHAFARFWRHNRESFSPRSRALLQRELKEKGIAPHIIDEALDGFDDEWSAYMAAQKKMKAFASLDYNGFHHRLGAFLRRRGFGYTIANHTVNQLWQEMGG